MLMVIFGAGASFDSDPYRRPSRPDAQPSYEQALRPPLACQLFDKRDAFNAARSRFPQMKPVVSRLREACKSNVEAELNAMFHEGAVNPKRPVQLAAIRYYLREAVYHCEQSWYPRTHGETNYLSLLDRVEQADPSGAPVMLVTFNYDTLVERALETFNGAPMIRTQEEYRSGRFSLFKLHGSTNWARSVSGVDSNADHELMARGYIEGASRLSLEGAFEFYSAEADPFAASIGGFPALAVPLAEKTEFECPPAHLAKLEAALPAVSRVVIVGWRGADRHFVEFLRNRLKGRIPCGVCNGDGAYHDTLMLMQEEQDLRALDYRPIEGGFSTLATTGVGDSLLSPKGPQ